MFVYKHKQNILCLDRDFLRFLEIWLVLSWLGENWNWNEFRGINKLTTFWPLLVVGICQDWYSCITLVVTCILFLENCLKSAYMHGFSPIRKEWFFLLKSMGQICPLDLILFRPVHMDWRITMHANGILKIFHEY